MKNDFIPDASGDMDAFEENLINKITIHAPALELNNDEVSDFIRTVSEHRTLFSNMISKRAESKSATESNRNSRERSEAEIRRIAKLIKSSRHYTPDIGEDLGIIGPDQTVKISSQLKPQLKAVLDGQEVVIKFRKEGTDGIKLYGKRGGETDFTFIAVDTSSPYNDTREKLNPGKPEQREYYAYYFESDSEIGQASDVLKVVVP